MRVELPGDQWAILRDVDELNTGDKLAVKRAMQIPVEEGGSIGAMSAAYADEMRIAMLARVITEWSYEGRPIPSLAMTPEVSVEQLSIPAYDALCAAIKPHMAAIENTPS